MPFQVLDYPFDSIAPIFRIFHDHVAMFCLYERRFLIDV